MYSRQSFVFLFTLVSFFNSLCKAAPIFQKRAFEVKDYNNFQISDGTAGNAKQAADAIFADSFANTDLKTVNKEDLDNVNTMARAAVDAEKNFNSALEAASGNAELTKELQAGKIANKVLKLSGEMQVLQIKQAQGKDVAAKMEEEQKKLNANIKKDTASANQKMRSFLNAGK